MPAHPPRIMRVFPADVLALAALLLLCGCGLVMQHRGYYIVGETARNHFVMDHYAHCELPLEDLDATLKVRVDQEFGRTLAMGPIVPIFPAFLVDKWDTTATSDPVLVWIHVQADRPVTLDWESVRLTLADGRPLQMERETDDTYVFGMPEEAGRFRAAIPPDNESPPTLLLTLSEFYVGSMPVSLSPIRLEKRIITRYFVGM
jgi:hypothetical protein